MSPDTLCPWCACPATYGSCRTLGAALDCPSLDAEARKAIEDDLEVIDAWYGTTDPRELPRG